MKIELGTIQFTAEFKNGGLQRGSPKLDILQDNIQEVSKLVPDGVYKWTLCLALDAAEKEAVTGLDSQASTGEGK